jgi:hypothetical protein
MRWFVEVASSGQREPPERWVVEAAQWQPALQAARLLRGDTAEMHGFSVELLDDGYRAIDPHSLLRYVVRRAPDGTPLSEGGRPGTASKRPSQYPAASPGLNGEAAAPAAGTSPVAPPSVVQAGGQAQRIAALLDLGGTGPARSRSAPPPPRPTSQPPPPLTSPSPPGTLQPQQAPGTQPGSPVAPPPPVAVPRPSGDSSSAQARTRSQPPPAVVPRPPSQPPPAQPRSASTSQPPPAPPAVPPLPRPVMNTPPPVIHEVSTSDLPSAELMFKRDEEPTEASPLTYRESAWLVPEGTSTEAAVRLLLGMFEGTRAALADVKPGKLVNMAAFDHRFQGKPQRPPLATLTWKDWKDIAPQIRRPGETAVSMVPQAPSPAFAQSLAPAPAPLLIPPPGMSPAPPAPAIPRPPAFVVPSVSSVVPPTPAPVPAAVPPPPVVASPAPVVASPTPAAAAPDLPRKRISSRPSVRLSGDELIADLFEAMHELHFAQDALAGADFVLQLTLGKLPSEVALVHFYDINAREFVVVRTRGPGTAKLLQWRSGEKEPLIKEAMGLRRSVVIADAGTDPRARAGRWALLDGTRSLVCAPVEQGGRFLGLLELANPRDGGLYTEGDGHALTYIGEQFAEFLASRGLILDPERIESR